MMKLFFKTLPVVLVFLLTGRTLLAQSLLYRNTSVHAKSIPLGNVLQMLERSGRFTFSYDSRIIHADSLVSLDVNNRPLKEILYRLLGTRFEFKEAGTYVIIRYAPRRLTFLPELMSGDSRTYSVNGFVADNVTGQRLAGVSVTEKKLLQAALTSQDGFFSMRLRNRGQPVALTLSKELYQDTTILLLQQVMVNPYHDTTWADNGRRYADLENTRLGRFLVSSRQKLQNLNLPGFIANSHYQASLTPGLSSHGVMSGQVVNRFSLNILGGYSAGVNGMEIGGLFNINRRDVQYVQLAGIFNLAGGNVSGVQAAGIYNKILGSAVGVHVAGIYNDVRDSLRGVEVSGILSRSHGSLRGLQISGISSYTRKTVKGAQIAGAFNYAGTGNVQIGAFNYARRLKGMQIGLVNVASRSDGLSLGLLNFIGKGYHKLVFSANELTDFNISLKTGNNALYTILSAGKNIENNQKLAVFGGGLGCAAVLGRHFSINPELSERYVYQGSFDYTNLLSRFDLGLHLKLNSWISVHGGPAFNLFDSNQQYTEDGYSLARSGKHRITFKNPDLKAWFGWTAGVSLF